MSLPSILIGAALILASFVIVAEPLLNKGWKRKSTNKAMADEPQRNYELALMSLRDLDFDHKLGIVPESDYARLREQYLAEAANTYENIVSDRAKVEEEIEAAVRMRHQQLKDGWARCPACKAELDPRDRFCSGCGTQVAKDCVECGRRVGLDENCCTSCGAQLR